MRWTNWYTHPADNRYHVFEFRDSDMAAEFEAGLKAEGIESEKGENEEQDLRVILFGVHRSVFKQALKVNHLVHGKRRAPFIPNALLRWGMLIITGLVILVAWIGWMKS